MDIKDKIAHIKICKIKVPIYNADMVLLGDMDVFPEPLTATYIDVGDLLEDMQALLDEHNIKY